MPRRKQTQPMQRKNSDEIKDSEERLSETGDLDDLLDDRGAPVDFVDADIRDAFSGGQNRCSGEGDHQVDNSELHNTFPDAPDLAAVATNDEHLSAGEGESESESDRHQSAPRDEFYITPESSMRDPCLATEIGFLETLPESNRMDFENEKENMRLNNKIKLEKPDKLVAENQESDSVDQPLSDIQMKRLCRTSVGQLGNDGISPCSVLSSGTFYGAGESTSTATTTSVTRLMNSSSFVPATESSVSASRQSSVKQLESFVASVECREAPPRSTPTLERKSTAPAPTGIVQMPVAALQSRKCKNSRLKTHAIGLPKLAKQVSTLTDSMRPFVAVSQNCDPNQPLDLSVKTTRPREMQASEDKYMSYSCSQDFSTSPLRASGSSLADLEKKFGNTSAIFDRIGTKTWASPFCGALVSRLGMNLYNSKLHGGSFGDSAAASAAAFGINMIPVPVQRFNSTQAAPAKSDASHVVKPDLTDAANDQESTSGVRNVTGTDSGFQWHSQKHTGSAEAVVDPQRKHTNFQCSCGAEFETLYHLTMHLQQTGHAPNKLKNAGRQEYSKLVRGQDMWLNHGCEQTRQILRCMECDESFKSLPELTVHMIQTKHYANIVGTDALQKKTSVPTKSCDNRSEPSSEEDEASRVHCLVCLETFDDPESLGTHIIEAGHYKGNPDRAVGMVDPTAKELSNQSGRSWQNSRSMTPVGPSSPQSEMDDNVDSLDALPCKTENDRKRYHSMSESSAVDDSKETVLKNRESSLRYSDSEDVPVKYKRFDEREPSSFIGTKNSPFSFNDNVNLDKSRSPVAGDSNLEEVNLKASGFQHHVSGLTDAEKSSRRQDEVQSEPNLNSSAFHVENFFRPSSNSSSDGSAIRAMETFIKKSFGSSESKSRLPALNQLDPTASLVGSLMSRFGCYVDHLGQSATARQEIGTSEALENSKNLYQNKYLPPVYIAPLSTDERPQGGDAILPGGQFLPTEWKIKSETAETTPKREPERTSQSSEMSNRESENSLWEMERPGSSEKLGKPNRRRQSQRRDQHSSPEYYGKSEADSIKRDNFLSAIKASKPVDLKSVERMKGEPNDLGDMETDERPSSTSNNNLSRSSALESLQGLVYGKALNTEHPLDSLQKLIYGRGNSAAASTPGRQAGASGHLLNGTNGTSHAAVLMKGSDSLHHPLPPGTLILVNPIVTVVPGASGSNPSLNITLPGCDSSPRLADDCGKLSELGGSRRNRSPTDDRENNLRIYRCRGCRRKFSSKGSYRYHLSRCHVLTSSSSSSTGEKFPSAKEPPPPPPRKSPFICMPLDATAKFNKYYQLASELGTEAK